MHLQLLSLEVSKAFLFRESVIHSIKFAEWIQTGEIRSNSYRQFHLNYIFIPF